MRSCRSCMPSLPSAPTVSLPKLSFEWPIWFTNCLGFVPGEARQDFVFDAYHSDEFDHLLSEDPGSRSFLSRLPFKRNSNRRLNRTDTNDTSTDASLRSLLIVDQDVELFGEDSINMLLTTNAPDAIEADLPSSLQPVVGQDEESLRREEEELRLTEETEIERKRQRARKLALERGLARNDTHSTIVSSRSSQGTVKTRSNRSPSVKSEMSMINKPTTEAAKSESPHGILPHMRPS